VKIAWLAPERSAPVRRLYGAPLSDGTVALSGGELAPVMHGNIFRRVITAVPTIFGITILIFGPMRILPGDPLRWLPTKARASTAYG